MKSEDLEPQVLVVDDDEGVRRFISTALTREGFAVRDVATGEQGLESASAAHPVAVLLDLTLPGISGLEICSRLRDWYKGPILVISANGDEATIVQALDLGADDYLTKPFRPAELAARIRALLRRAPDESEQESRIAAGGLNIDLAQRRIYRDSEEIRLTRTEFDITACLAKRRDRVVTAETILRTVWGPHHGEYAQTLRVHIGHIRRKLEPTPSSPRYIITEPGVGYRLCSHEGRSGAHA